MLKQSDVRPSLTIVLPALNEEEAIAGTIQRCLSEREAICRDGGVRQVEILVVSDGSTDQTADIARSFEGVQVHEFVKNRGYGAALQWGFRHASGDLVGFMDADGTCDPAYFAQLCRAITTEGADIALGSRLGPESRMPGVRILGNRLFAGLLGVVSNRTIVDTASGMRVLRKSTLESLGPLPNGLHYTPAMSARAVLGGHRVLEIPVRYQERIGTSKLSVISDGFRFLLAIGDGLLLFRPQRLFLAIGVVLAIGAAALSLNPIEHYATNSRVEDWMIYRFVVAFLLGAASVTAVGTAALGSRLTGVVGARDVQSFWSSIVESTFSGKCATAIVFALVALASVLVHPGVQEYLTTGRVSLHWSRVIVAAFALLTAFQVLLTALLLRIMRHWIEAALTRSSSAGS
jgi:glycosyltransferase involved in cell wall biosynthesis